jgi:hypothetical protein
MGARGSSRYAQYDQDIIALHGGGENRNDIAKLLGCPYWYVGQVLHRLDIEKRYGLRKKVAYLGQARLRLPRGKTPSPVARPTRTPPPAAARPVRKPLRPAQPKPQEPKPKRAPDARPPAPPAPEPEELTRRASFWEEVEMAFNRQSDKSNTWDAIVQARWRQRNQRAAYLLLVKREAQGKPVSAEGRRKMDAIEREYPAWRARYRTSTPRK